MSVVIPTRNRFLLLAEAIESIRAQTLRDWEVIVVDDASDDGSTDQTTTLLRDDPRMRIEVLKERSERSTARNIGLARASGRYVLFLDDDDRLVGNALERLGAVLDRDADAVVAIGARRFFDPHGHTRRAPHPRFRVRRKLTHELLLGWVTAWVAVPGQCLIRTDALRKAGGWNATLVGPEDQELLLRMTSHRPAVLVPSVVLEYRLHANQWRPPDVRYQEEAFRLETASRLAAEGNYHAMRVLQAGKFLRRADRSYDRWEYRPALAHLNAAVRTAPVILKSPIVGPSYLHLWVKSLVGSVTGSAGARAIRNIRGGLRQRLGRSPNAEVTVLQDARMLPGRTAGYEAPSSVNREIGD